MATYTSETRSATTWTTSSFNQTTWVADSSGAGFNYLCSENDQRLITEDGARIIFNITPTAQVWDNEIKN